MFFNINVFNFRLNCIKKRSHPTEAEMGTTEQTKSVPEDV